MAYSNTLKETLNSDRTSIVHGSQGDATVLKRLSLMGNYSIIIDDGSHVPSHQWNTFLALWQVIAPGGLYIIEDVETNYWSKRASVYGNSLRNEENIMSNFKALIDRDVNAEFYGGIDNGQIEYIQFYRNCIILKKKREISQRTYRFKHHIRGERLPHAK